MRVIGEFNNISDELKKQIVPLKPGEYAHYQLTTFQTIPDIQPGTMMRKYRHELIYAKDTIFDPFYKSPDASHDAAPEGRAVEIGVPAPDGINLKEKQVTKVLTYEFRDPKGGSIILSGHNLADREMHEFLQLTNRLKDGILAEHRDSSIEAIFVMVNKPKEAKIKNAHFKAKAQALSYVEKMTVDEMREFAAARNWNYKADQVILSQEIYEYAEKNPVQFAEEATSGDLKRKAAIKIALEEGVITFDPNAYKMTWKNGDILAQLERRADRNEIDAFNEWLLTSANGTQIFNQLRKKSPKEKEVATP